MRFTLLCLFAASAAAAPALKIAKVGLGGAGCPDGTARGVVSADATTVSVLFDQYLVDSKTSPFGYAVHTCDVAITLEVPQGISVALIGLDYRGWRIQDAGSTTKLTAQYFFAGRSVGQEIEETWVATKQTTEQFFVRDTVAVGAVVYAACGEQAILRASTALHASTLGSTATYAVIQLTSTEITAKMLWSLKWRTC